MLKQIDFFGTVMLTLASLLAFLLYSNIHGLAFVCILAFISLALMFSTIIAKTQRRLKGSFLDKVAAFVFTICITVITREIFENALPESYYKSLDIISAFTGMFIGYITIMITIFFGKRKKIHK